MNSVIQFNDYDGKDNKILKQIAECSCVIFDLDGTLINTIDDLGFACDYILKKQGIEPIWTLEDYKRFVGNGAKLLVKRAFNNTLSESELDELYKQFKVRYNEIKLDNAYAYDGIIDVVNILKKSGRKLLVCTNKPDKAAKGMVEAIFGKNAFDVIQGAVDGKPTKPDPTVPLEILNSLNIAPEKAVWIGDSDVDILSAENLGCKSIAVTWGFRSRESLINASPAVIIDLPKDILKIFNLDIDNK